MPFKNENFSDLKLSTVRDFAQGWVKDYPCIEKIALYEIGFEFGSPLKYIIVVTVPKRQYSYFKNDEGLRCFSWKYKDINIEGYKKDYDDIIEKASKENPEFGDLVAYHRWAGIDGCDHISACIPLFYKKEDRLLDWQRAQLVEEWYWWEVEPGEDVEDLNREANGFVQELTKMILYPLVAGCLEDGSQNTIGQSKTSDNEIYDEKPVQTLKDNDPQAGPFKSNHEDAKDLMTEEHTHYKRLNSNGYDFYKQKEFWTPLEAASIVSGYLYADSPFECNFDQIKPLYEKSIKAVFKKKLEVSRIICINDITLMVPYKRYCPEFYEADEIYERGHIKCFNPINYVEWIKHERIVKIPPELITCVDEEGMAAWTKSPNYNPNERKFILGLAFHHLNKSDKERKDRYNYYKSLSSWKIAEAAALLLEKTPKGLSLDDDETSQLIDFLLRAIERGDLNRIDKQGKCYLKPFEVLELANKAEMKIPCELEYRSVGEKEFEWETQATKVEQVIKNKERINVEDLETDLHRTDFSVKNQNGKNAESANHKKAGALPKIIDTFPELNLDHLKRITGRWVTKYHRRGVSFSRIVLYRYASDYFGSQVPVKYTIVFEMPHYEPAPRPDAQASTKEHLKWIKTSSSKPEDPYDSFIHRDLGYNSTVIRGLQERFIYSDFGLVYNPPRTEGFKQEWKLIPQYKGLTLYSQVRIKEGFVVLFDEKNIQHSQSCNSPQIVKRKTEREERILFDFFLKPIGKYYDIGCPGSKKLQYEYFSEPMNIIPLEKLESIQRQLMGFCMWLEPFPKGSLRSEDHPYYFIQDVVAFLKQNKKYFPKKGSEDLNAYLETLKIKFQEFINDIYLKKRLPLLLEALAQETKMMGIVIDEIGIELESSDGKLEHAPKNNDPQEGSFKSNHEDVNRNTIDQDSDHTRSFVLRVDRWDITFDGAEPIILNDSKPIIYLLEVLKNPKKNIPYSTIVDIVAGSNQTHKTNKHYSEMAKDKENERLEEDGLTEKSNAEMDSLYTEEDVKEIFKNLEEQYLKLKDGTQKEKDWINEGIRFFEREYWYRVIKTKDSIRLGQKSNVSKRAKDDSSLIRNSIKGVMKRLKGKSLHRHLELYLHIKNGVKYDPPEDQPLWEIKDT